MHRGGHVLGQRFGDVGARSVKGAAELAAAGADAAILEAISRLSDENAARHPSIGTSSFAFEHIPVVVQMSIEDGRIDLNTADRDLILAFLQSQGVSQDAASTMLEDLRFWQGAIHDKSVQGNGLESPPAEGTAAPQLLEMLQSADEVRRIPSWSARPLDCWLEYFTVYTHLPSVSIQYAPAQVLAALRWAQDHHLDNRDWVFDSQFPSSATTQSMIGEVVRISATATLANELSATSEWVGRLTGESRRPFLTLRWTHSKLAPKVCSSPVE